MAERFRKRGNKKEQKRNMDLRVIFAAVGLLGLAYLVFPKIGEINTQRMLDRANATDYAAIQATATARTDPAMFATEVAGEVPDGNTGWVGSAFAMYSPGKDGICSGVAIEEWPLSPEQGNGNLVLLMTTYHCLADENGVFINDEKIGVKNTQAVLSNQPPVVVEVLSRAVIENTINKGNEPQVLLIGRYDDTTGKDRMPTPVGLENIGCGPIQVGEEYTIVAFPGDQPGGKRVPLVKTGQVLRAENQRAEVVLGLTSGGSGGGLFDTEKGCVAGLAIGTDDGRTDIVYQIPDGARGAGITFWQGYLQQIQSISPEP